MLVLQANQEQENTFQKLIQTMGEQIVWEGRFIVRDNELILEGTVRSLVFQFETKKVVTNLLDIPVNESQVVDVSRHPRLKDLINMALYAFGKWGMLRGLRVEQDYQQLNQLFSKIMNMYYIEPSFRKENFRFYKVGVRITYEEVLQTVLEFEKKQEDDPLAETQGLWHTLVWKNRERVFRKSETTLEERAQKRIGNNFYLVGYQCPKCSEKLFMAVYPDGKEVRIDTDEKGVYLARAYTCDKCCCFYTPRPDRLISEGLIYEMAFGDDRRAYDDYMELLGHNAERAANFKYNEYEAIRRQRIQRELKEGRSRQKSPDYLHSPQEALNQLRDFSKNAASLPDDVFRRFAHRVEEGFYPDAAVAKYEKKILKQVRELDARDAQKRAPASGKKTDSAPGNRGMQTGERHGSTAPGRSGVPYNRRAKTKANAGYPGNMQAERQLNTQSGSPKTKGMQTGTGILEAVRGGSTHAGAQEHAGSAAAGNGIPEDMHNGSAGNGAQEIVYHISTGTGRRKQGSESPKIQPYGTVYGGQQADSSLSDEYEAEDDALERIQGRTGVPGSAGGAEGQPALRQNDPYMGSGAVPSENAERYQARLGVLDRLSDRQRAELKRQIKNDTSLSEAEKKELNGQITEMEFQKHARNVLKRAESGLRYEKVKGLIQDMDREDYPEELKRPVLDQLQKLQRQRGEEEVQKVIETVPERLDREGYQKLEAKLKTYEGVDLSPYTEKLHDLKEAAEKQEIANIVKRSRKMSRGDYTGLMRRLEEKEFADENVTPYMEKIKEKVQQLDEDRINELMDQADDHDFNSLASVYEQLDAESFLPELKTDAMEMIAKRLEKIRTDECELLVHKLQDEMEGRIKENARHHFYPARKVMLKRAEPEETRAIDAALAAYAGGRSRFEYPVFVADTSRNHNGREGMVLTPENLFYSTRLNAYQIPVNSIDSIQASTGLLNRKITLAEADGTEHRLPYAVRTGEMEEWAEILEDFVHYLQEKPPSRKLPYLAKETHDTICCYRCGYVYRERDVCPECGYKKNR